MSAPITSHSQKELLLGEELVKALYRLLQAVHLHRENNRTVVACAENFVQAATQVDAPAGELGLECVGEQLFLQGQRLRARPENRDVLARVHRFFERRNLVGLRLFGAVSRASLAQVVVLARLLNQARDRDDSAHWLADRLSSEGIGWAEPIHLRNRVESEQRRDRGERARRTYAYVLGSVRDVAEKIAAGRRAGIGPVLRVTQSLVDLMMADEPLFLALSTIRVHDDYTYAHSVNVGVLAMCLGRRLGLSRRSLERMGVCGLLHDLGKVEVPRAILNKAGALTDQEFDVMKRHSIDSVRLIVRLQASRDRKARLVLPPFEHHLRYDLSGYPQTRRKAPLTLFGRMLTIVDVYDAVTSPRVYRRTVMRPDQALAMMAADAGRTFDPALLKVFINLLGVYPVGSLLELGDGTLALVSRSSDPGRDPARPAAVRLAADSGGKFRRGEEIDLAETDAVGRLRHAIVQAHHPREFEVDPAAILLGDGKDGDD